MTTATIRDYLRTQGPWLLGAAAAYVASLGVIALGKSLELRLLEAAGGLGVLISGIAFVWWGFRALMLLLVIAWAVGTVVVMLADAFRPLLGARSVFFVSWFVVAVAAVAVGVWVHDGWRRSGGWRSATRDVRRRLAAARPGAVTLTLTRPPLQARINRPPRRNRVCRACGGMIAAHEEQCPNPDCPEHQE